MPADPLCMREREEIRVGIVRGLSFRAIGYGMGRDPSTVSREVARNGGRDRYRVFRADVRARENRKRSRVPKLVANRSLARTVTTDLKIGYSPAGIAARLRRAGGETVSHETIYRAIYSPKFVGIDLSGRDCLRTRRRHRFSRNRPTRTVAKRFGDFKPVADRPCGANDRTEPGHWEGDLIIGANQGSAIVTLVERVSRQIVLARLPHRRTSPDLRRALNRAFKTVPAAMRQSLTWDQGVEITEWERIETDLGLDIYICRPHSPWERGSNERANRQLRYWLPKKTNLKVHSQQRLNQIAKILNTQPRRIHNWKTPQDIYNQQIDAMTV